MESLYPAQSGGMARLRETFQSNFYEGQTQEIQGTGMPQMFEIQRQRLTPPRTLSLIRPDEPHGLLNFYSVALTNAEMFEGEISPGGLNRVVGMRCLRCGASQHPHPHYARYPQNVQNVGEALRQLYVVHLMKCPLIPGAVRDFLKEGVQAVEPRGSPSFDGDGFRKLTHHCLRRCNELGIVDKFPQNTGIVFRDEPLPAFPQTRHSGSQVPMYEHTQPNAHAPLFPVQYPPDLPAPQRHQESSTSMARIMPTAERSPYRSQGTSFDAPANYPFSREPDGSWVCKYCVNIPLQYRDPNYRWQGPEVPSPRLIDSHFEHCQGYQRSIRPAFALEEPSYLTSTQQPRPLHSTARSEYGQPIGGRASSSSLTSDQGFGIRGMSNQNHPAPARSTPSDFQQQLESIDHDSAHLAAMQYLMDHDKSILTIDGNPLPLSEQLVHENDKILLTDYFFYAMKQLRKVSFTEADRKTRGGKREKIAVGFGGLQCVHCVNAPSSRKFFWSNVDRLANSFAEIPNHVRRCRHCPEHAKLALAKLHERHAQQMAPLPRGSQKIFFRRVWRRLHPQSDLDPEVAPIIPAQMAMPESPRQAATASPLRGPASSHRLPESLPHAPKPPPTSHIQVDTSQSRFSGPSPSRTEGSDESVMLLERSTEEAAKSLATSSIQAGPPSPNSRVLLAIPDDKDWISETDAFVRRQVEVFCATVDDVQAAELDRKFPVKEGQVGIRCLHCAIQKQGPGANREAVMYPFSVNAIYENVREFQRAHLDYCPSLPAALKTKYQGLRGTSSLSSVLRNYYVISAKSLGLHDTKSGLRAGGDRSKFFNVSEAMRQEEDLVDESSPRKRKNEDPINDSPQKKPASSSADQS